MLNESFIIKSKRLYISKCIVYLEMNTQTQIKNVFAIVASIAILSGFMSTVNAQEAYIPYGTQVNNNDIAYEDKLYIIANDEHVYINVVPLQGEGQFALTGLETDYTVDEAIERFGIHEDSESFVVESFANISDVGIVYEFVESSKTFQLIGAIEV